MATHSRTLAWKIPWIKVGYSPWGCKDSDASEHTSKICRKHTQLIGPTCKKKSNLKNGEGGSAEIFFQRRHRDVSTRYMKRCSVSLIVREMLIKASIRYHLTPVRMAIYKERKDSKCMEGCGKENLCVLFWGMQIGATTMENSMKVPKKIKNITTV